MWWPFSQKAQPDAATRTDRAKCWESRDAYFACLDAHNVIVAGKEEGACNRPLKAYEENCAKSWIDYFNQRRVLAERQKPMLEQAAWQAEDAKKRGV
ncbi:unnamed protein product [Peniophora sp. CBMAI 1063]|nr:unnamed protein product [Peniophora sp. CBMAI 1063]